MNLRLTVAPLALLVQGRITTSCLRETCLFEDSLRSEIRHCGVCHGPECAIRCGEIEGGSNGLSCQATASSGRNKPVAELNAAISIGSADESKTSDGETVTIASDEVHREPGVGLG